MKLLLISIEFPPGPGGLGTLAFQAASGLAELGWQVRVATPQANAAPAEIERFNTAQAFCVHRFQYLGPMLVESADRLGRTLALMRRERPDVILAVGKQAIWLGGVVGTLTQVPLAVVAAGTEFLPARSPSRWLTRWVLNRAKLVLPISRYTAELVALLGVPALKVRIITCGADEQLFQPGLPTADLRHRLNLGSAHVILTVGQISERKAQDTVVRALPRILEVYPEVVYLVVGLPTRQQELRLLAQELGVAGNVIFMGLVRQSDLPYYYNLAEIFILVSRRTQKGDVEGFGIAAVEAALCEVPAVVSSHGGLPEAVLPGETALVVPPDEPQATAEAILRLLKDNDLRQAMGRAARRHALAHATWNKRVREYNTALMTISLKK